ncbi:MAG: hypothetical protein VB046_10615 [Paludibacter sp.]|nr:hypothetical protein [Paludibacter sp.]
MNRIELFEWIEQSDSNGSNRAMQITWWNDSNNLSGTTQMT